MTEGSICECSYDVQARFSFSVNVVSGWFGSTARPFV